MVTLNDGSTGRNGQSRPEKASSKAVEVVVSGVALPVTVYAGQRVVTLAQMDAVHQRPDGTARRNFNQHRERLIEGEDFVQIGSDEIRTINPAAIPAGSRRDDVVLLTESGYLMLVKSFTDDLAWTVQRQLVASYFRVSAPARVSPPQSVRELIGARLAIHKFMEARPGVDRGMLTTLTLAALQKETGMEVEGYRHALPARAEPLPSLNATELAKAIGGITARALNQRLQALGYQTKNARDEWELTDSGRPFGDMVPFTQHGHSSWQLRWKPDAVDQLRKQVHQPVQPGLALNGGAA